MGIRDHLRKSTHQRHLHLDERMGDLGSLSSPEGYRNYLRTMLALHLQYAPAIRRVSLRLNDVGAELSLPAVSVQECLRADLASADANDREFGEHQPLSLEETEPPSAADWGEAYVMEGSAMGGRFLLAKAEQELPAKMTTKFLTRMAEDAKHRWPKFIAALESLEKLSVDEAVQAAERVFIYAEEVVDRIVGESGQSSSQSPSSQ